MPARARPSTILQARRPRMDDRVMLHVLEGLEVRELDYLDSSSFMPDEFNWTTLCQTISSVWRARHCLLRPVHVPAKEGSR